jgi:hypothetical protein
MDVAWPIPCICVGALANAWGPKLIGVGELIIPGGFAGICDVDTASPEREVDEEEVDIEGRRYSKRHPKAYVSCSDVWIIVVLL